MTDRLDLPSPYRKVVEALLREHVPDAAVWAYGSRVNGMSHPGSDLDLVLRSPTLEQLGDGFHNLVEAFQESNIPILIQAHDWARLPESFHREIERDYVVVQQGAGQTTAGEWREVTLSDLIDIKHGFAFKGTSIHDAPQGDILLTPGNFAIGGGFKGDKFKYYDGPIPEEFVLGEGDLLVSMTDLSKQSDTLGYPALVPSRPDGRRYLHNQRLGKISLKKTGEAFARYIYYLLCSTEYRSEVLASATGTTVKHTSPERIKQFRFTLPPLPEQRAIAHILGTLDDKIELNRRMNETLEEMARALFQSWFVDFDPVRAKMEGRDTGLPPDLAALFPDRLVDSELGLVPEGWEVGVLSDAIELLSGGTPKTSMSSYWGGAIPWYTAKDAPGLSDVFALVTERTITQAGVENSATEILPVGTTIITARGTVGRLACLGVPMAMNQTCYGIRGGRGYTDFFTYWNVRKAVDDLKARTHGTIFDTITRDTFRFVETVLAPLYLAEAFESIVSSTMERIRQNLLQSQTFATLRDGLLPKLVSGEVRMG